MNRDRKVFLAVVIIALVSLGAYFAATRYLLNPRQAPSQPLTCSASSFPYATNEIPRTRPLVARQLTQGPTLPLQVVAGENFWGSLISQLGGDKVQVTSIVTNPNTDPHDYENSVDDARAFANANLVIINGAGYDNWASHILAANTNSHPDVLNVADLLGKKEGDNPHFWYGPAYVNVTVHEMYSRLVNLDSADTTYYAHQYQNLNMSLGKYNGLINDISNRFHGQRVGSTESIFQYLAQAANLDLISPYPFMKAVAEGSDPSPGCVAVFQSQLLNPSSSGNATVLIYNAQTVTPITQQLKTEATQNGIPTVAVYETVQPQGVTFQDWMYSELVYLETALDANALGH